jgi:hypothetical protein
MTFSLAIPLGRLESGTAKFSTETPNLGITSISSKKTVVGLYRTGYGYLNLGINVTNYGTEAETFNTTFYMNSTIVGEILNTTIEGQNSTLVVFRGTITHFAYGNYSISASITPVINETELSDNFIDNLWIFLTIMGDINGDKWVDIYDAVLLVGPFWVFPCIYPYHPPPNADLNDSGNLDIFDVILLAGNFNRHWE